MFISSIYLIHLQCKNKYKIMKTKLVLVLAMLIMSLGTFASTKNSTSVEDGIRVTISNELTKEQIRVDETISVVIRFKVVDNLIFVTNVNSEDVYLVKAIKRRLNYLKINNASRNKTYVLPIKIVNQYEK